MSRRPIAEFNLANRRINSDWMRLRFRHMIGLKGFHDLCIVRYKCFKLFSDRYDLQPFMTFILFHDFLHVSWFHLAILHAPIVLYTYLFDHRHCGLLYNEISFLTYTCVWFCPGAMLARWERLGLLFRRDAHCAISCWLLRPSTTWMFVDPCLRIFYHASHLVARSSFLMWQMLAGMLRIRQQAGWVVTACMSVRLLCSSNDYGLREARFYYRL